jgi:hypothetical protein
MSSTKLDTFQQEIIRLLTENNAILKENTRLLKDNQKLLLSIDENARKIKANTN